MKLPKHAPVLLIWFGFAFFLVSSLLDACLVPVGFLSIISLALFAAFAAGSVAYCSFCLIRTFRDFDEMKQQLRRIFWCGVPILVLAGMCFEASKARTQNYVPVSPTLRMSLATFDAWQRLKWHRSQWQRVEIRGNTLCGAVDGDELKIQLEDSLEFLSELESKTGLRQNAPVTLIRSPTSTNSGQAFLRMATSSHADQFRDVDRHELAHLFLNQHVNLFASPPHALSEGWAIYCESPDRDQLDRELAAYLRKYTPDLDVFFCEPSSHLLGNGSYVVGSSVVYEMIEQYGIQDFCKFYCSCTTQAFSDCFQTHFEESWHEFKRRFLLRILNIAAPDSSWPLAEFETTDVENQWRIFNALVASESLIEKPGIIKIAKTDGDLRYTIDSAEWVSDGQQFACYSSNMNGEYLFAVSADDRFGNFSRLESNSKWNPVHFFGFDQIRELVDRYRSGNELLNYSRPFSFFQQMSDSLHVTACKKNGQSWTVTATNADIRGNKIQGTFSTVPHEPDRIQTATIEIVYPDQDFASESQTFNYEWGPDAELVPERIVVEMRYDSERPYAATFEVGCHSVVESASRRFDTLTSGLPLVESSAAPSFSSRNILWSVGAIIVILLLLTKHRESGA